MADTKFTEISASLLQWYKTSARDLPWRRSVTPYTVLVSEIMLQQTQVATVIPYFERWMHHFPDLPSLAAASEEEVIRLWEGLGYYRRARSLHRLAKEVLQHHAGRLPGEEHDLLHLPGIGPYTSGAILSIAFNRPVPAVDGNVERVLARIFNVDMPLNRAAGKRRIQNLACALIPEGKARHLNQALMELGATVCLPRSPRCGLCPCREHCTSLTAETVPLRPVKPPRPETVKLYCGSLLAWRKDKLLVFRRPSSGLMAGLWEFPTFHFTALPTACDMDSACRILLEMAPQEISQTVTVRHAFTRYRVTLRAFETRHICGPPKGIPGWQLRWISPEDITKLPFSAGSRKVREKSLRLPAEALPR